MIVKKGPRKYILYSHSGKVLGTFTSRAAAERRERQIIWFKNHSRKRKRKRK